LSDRRDVEWGAPEPFVVEITVDEAAIDGLGHANNSMYMRWSEQVGWAHSESLQLGLGRWLELDRALATHRAVLNFRAPCFLGDHLLAATWIIKSDGRLLTTRRFEIRRAGDGKLLFDAEVDYACISIESGRPKRFPPEFTERFIVLPAVQKWMSQRAE